MKLLSYQYQSAASFGVLQSNGIIDLKNQAHFLQNTLLDVLRDRTLQEIAQSIAGLQATIQLSDVVLDVPLPNAPRIFCIGRNYKGHLAEINAKLPEQPSLFFRTMASMVACNQPLIRPQASTDFDYEGELALVIGKPAKNVSIEHAMQHIMAYTIVNDGSIRDYQFKHSLTVGKNFEKSGSMGPWITTVDEVGDPSQLEITTTLNGVQVQHSGTDDLIFDIPTIVHYISSFTTLMTGDIIATGTPDGVGFTRTPPLWLKQQDVLEISISRLGTLRHTVINE